jgi:hypothetical protein
LSENLQGNLARVSLKLLTKISNFISFKPSLNHQQNSKRFYNFINLLQPPSLHQNPDSFPKNSLQNLSSTDNKLSSTPTPISNPTTTVLSTLTIQCRQGQLPSIFTHVVQTKLSQNQANMLIKAPRRLIDWFPSLQLHKTKPMIHPISLSKIPFSSQLQKNPFNCYSNLRSEERSFVIKR